MKYKLENINSIFEDIEQNGSFNLMQGNAFLRNELQLLEIEDIIEPFSNGRSYRLTDKGLFIVKNGGYEKGKVAWDLYNKKSANSINIVGNISNSPIIQDSSLGDLEFHQIEKKYPNKPATISQKESTIFEKIKSFTNHQVIGGLIVGGIIAYITYKCSK